MKFVKDGIEALTPDPGVYKNIPFDEYKQWNAMSKSMTGPALRSGRHLAAYLNTDRSTPSLQLGSLVDAMALEPDTVDALFAVQPSTYIKETWKGRAPNKELIKEVKPWNMNSNSCKETLAKLQASGKSVIPEETWKLGEACRDALLAHDTAGPVLRDGEAQISVLWLDPDTGVPCKGRFDILHGGYIYDLKTAQDASPAAFARTVAKFGYHIQAGIYSEAYKILTGEQLNFRFIVVETAGGTDTPQVATYEMLYDDESMVAGRLNFKRAVNKASFYPDDPADLPGYSQFAEPIAIPRWAINQEFDLHEEVSL